MIFYLNQTKRSLNTNFLHSYHINKLIAIFMKAKINQYHINLILKNNPQCNLKAIHLTIQQIIDFNLSS
jgi:hypothetical protein